MSKERLTYLLHGGKLGIAGSELSKLVIYEGQHRLQSF